MKNLKIGNDSYSGISTLVMNTLEGGNATFKDVDEIEPITVSDIPTEETFFATTTEEMTFNAFFDANKLNCSKDGVYFIRIYGDTAPTQGTKTIFGIIACFNEKNVQSGVARPNNSIGGMLASGAYGTNSLVAPNEKNRWGELHNMNMTYGFNQTYITRDAVTKNLWINANQAVYVPANATVKYTYLPLDVLTFTKI